MIKNSFNSLLIVEKEESRKEWIDKERMNKEEKEKIFQRKSGNNQKNV